MADTFRDDTLFTGFSWHSDIPTAVEAAKPILETARLQHRSSVVWPAEVLADGVFLRWKQEAPYRCGYEWFNRRLGTLVETPRQGPAWRVRGHRGGYQAPLRVQTVYPKGLDNSASFFDN